ncbi:MAG: outer membrane lipoprotein-sorting protein [Kiritimatiellia bacterium]
MKASLLLLACAGFALFADEAPRAAIERVTGGAKAPPALTLEASAADVLRTCRAMLPSRPVELTGALILRTRKGIVSSEHDYRLVMRRSEDVSLLTIHLFPRGKTNEVAAVTISRRPGSRPLIRLAKAGAAEAEVVASPLARVLETDVTWLDLTFDFLWWPDAAYEAEREGESIHGQKCLVILVKPEVKIDGLSAVRIWVDKKTGCLMQAEQVGEDGKPLRRLWGTRVKKMDGKWMVSVLEVETLGSRHRTKITVDGLREL